MKLGIRCLQLSPLSLLVLAHVDLDYQVCNKNISTLCLMFKVNSVPRITRPLDVILFHISTASIELHPRFGSMLGGTPVLFDPGVPFAGNEEIDCDFDGIKTSGVHINSNLALCVSPTLPDFSSIPFELTITGRAPQQTEFLSGTLCGIDFTVLTCRSVHTHAPYTHRYPPTH